MFQQIQKKGRFIQFYASQPVTEPLDRDRLIKQINLEFAASAVVAGGAASGTVVEDSVLILIPRIEIVGNGQTIFNMDAQALYFMNQFEHNIAGSLLEPTSGDEATYPIYANMVISFENNIGRYPEDTFLPARLFKDLNIRFTYGTCNSMFEGTYDRGCTIAASYGVTMIVIETTAPDPKFMRQQLFIEKTIAASQTDFPVDLPAGRYIYQKLLFKTLDANVRSNDIINKITVETDTSINNIKEIPYDQLRKRNIFDHRITVPTGFAYLYLAEQGMLSTALNTSDINTLQLKLDVTKGSGTTLLRVYYDVIRPLSSFFG